MLMFMDKMPLSSLFYKFLRIHTGQWGYLKKLPSRTLAFCKWCKILFGACLPIFFRENLPIKIISKLSLRSNQSTRYSQYQITQVLLPLSTHPLGHFPISSPKIPPWLTRVQKVLQSDPLTHVQFLCSHLTVLIILAKEIISIQQRKVTRFCWWALKM